MTDPKLCPDSGLCECGLPEGKRWSDWPNETECHAHFGVGPDATIACRNRTIARLRASRSATIDRLRGFRERFDKLMDEIEREDTGS
jgi:hypothetical protein